MANKATPSHTEKVLTAHATNLSTSSPNHEPTPHDSHGGTQQSFRFMELPPELRINIYEALLVDHRAHDERGWLLGNDDCKLHTAVLRTSKQIYSEARPVLYGKNKFSVIIGHT